MLPKFEGNEGNWANIIVLLSVELQLFHSGLYFFPVFSQNV